MSKPTLLLTRGIPGSGKSTFAREWVDEDPEARVRLNRDDIRQMMFAKGHGLTFAQEKMVSRTQRSAARAHLRDGRSVIIDDTNLRLKFARTWATMAQQVDAIFEVRDFVIDVEEAVQHDARRDDWVGDAVVRDFARRYPYPWPEITPFDNRKADEQAPRPYVMDATRPPAWIVDIDGTLAHHESSGRSPYDWSRVGEDDLDPVVAGIVDILKDYGAQIILVSGRDGICEPETRAWLTKHAIPWDYLFMRQVGDSRADYVVKAEIFDQSIRDNFAVVGVLDDRDSVVKMWRSMGLKCLQVQAGGF